LSIPQELNLNTENMMCSLTEHPKLQLVDVKMVPTNIIGRRAVALGRLWGL